MGIMYSGATKQLSNNYCATMLENTNYFDQLFVFSAIEGFFPFRRMDICQEGSLDFISDKSIDIANASYLFNSPTLRRLGHNSEKLQRLLLSQLERIVKPEGYFLHNGMSTEFEDAFAIIIAASMKDTSVEKVNKFLYGEGAQ